MLCNMSEMESWDDTEWEDETLRLRQNESLESAGPENGAWSTYIVYLFCALVLIYSALKSINLL